MLTLALSFTILWHCARAQVRTFRINDSQMLGNSTYHLSQPTRVSNRNAEKQKTPPKCWYTSSRLGLKRRPLFLQTLDYLISMEKHQYRGDWLRAASEFRDESLVLLPRIIGPAAWLVNLCTGSRFNMHASHDCLALQYWT